MNPRALFLLTGISFLASPGNARSKCRKGQQVCHPEDTPIVCGVPSRCSTTNPFYQRGGSAQAYVPDAPIKSSVCDSNLKSSYKASTWPFGRKSRRKAPKVSVNLRLFECAASTTETAMNKKKHDQCCCSPLTDTQAVQIEVWQAKPNGQYSSLSTKGDSCRATLNGTLFTTLAPGSTGILGGLGPAGWDFMPYGAPAIHMLFTSQHHHMMLVHLPVVLDRKLQQRPFSGPDLRGPAYVTPKIRGESYSIEQWKVEGDSIEIHVNIYLRTVNEWQQDRSKTLCPSSVYGSPASFFLEPIAVCAPSILDFFEL